MSGVAGRAFYNEIDPSAAAWLRELIAAGLVCPGDVDERDIRDILPGDLDGYSQCHFFAGVGGWSYALRLAGWPDDRPVWTGSCPCQPFSQAGRGAGFADERHLWPAFHWLIEQCRPAIVFGEQVASKDGLGWLDLVQADLEGSGYAVGAADLCAAGVGAPHIRQRLWWVADGVGDRLEGAESSFPRGRGRRSADPGSAIIGMADAEGGRRLGDGRAISGAAGSAGGAARAEGPSRDAARRRGPDGGLADAERDGRGTRRAGEPGGQPSIEPDRHRAAFPLADSIGSGLEGRDARALGGECQTLERGGEAGELGDTDCNGSSSRDEATEAMGYGHPADAAGRGPWSDLVWLPCRDGKARPTQPGIFPLAHGVSGRVGLLRGAGNAIVPQVAAAFIEASLISSPPAHGGGNG